MKPKQNKNKRSSKKVVEKSNDSAYGTNTKLLGSVGIVALSIVIAQIIFTNSDSKNYINANVTFDKKYFKISCKSEKNADIHTSPVFEGCTPTKICGRGVKDNLITAQEVLTLQNIAIRIFEKGQSNGGASIFDMHSGALSMGDQFVNIYKYFDQDELQQLFTKDDLMAYKSAKNKILNSVAEQFGVNKNKLYLTSPSFFSRLTNKTAKTTHDEYWHVHVDKIQYGSFDYTTLLYLSDYGKDFYGGRFMFDSDATNDVIVEPKAGRVSFFTSGAENPHHVEKLESGIRYAITVSFTCDPKKAIQDPDITV